jgi:nucleoside-diphosphate-sugar epimerase
MVYGGGAAPGNMMKLIRLCDRPLPLPFRGTDNRRQFAYAGLVSDALESILAGREEGVFLVADRRAVSTGELVSIIRSILGRAEMQFPLPSAASSIIRKFAPALYRKLLGSLVIHTEESFRRLQIDSSGEDLEKGIEEMVEYYRLL